MTLAARRMKWTSSWSPPYLAKEKALSCVGTSQVNIALCQKFHKFGIRVTWMDVVWDIRQLVLPHIVPTVLMGTSQDLACIRITMLWVYRVLADRDIFEQQHVAPISQSNETSEFQKLITILG
jgi:hypothetical protein